jgi:hypothetical protein
VTARKPIVATAAACSLFLADPAFAQIPDGLTVTCWPCNAVLYAMALAESLTTGAANQIASAVWPFFMALVSISLLWGICTSVVAGTSVVPAILDTLARFAVLAVLFTIPAGIGAFATDYAVLPPLQTGAALGNSLSATATQTLGIGIPATTCQSMQPADVGLKATGFTAAAQSLLSLTCTVHQATMVAYSAGAAIGSQELRSGTTQDKRFALFYASIGSVIMFAAMMALLDFALCIFECIVRLTVWGTFAPFIAFFWLYRPLRGAVRRAFAQLVYTFVYLAFMGLASAIVVLMLYTGMALGLGLPATPLPSPATILSTFNAAMTTGSTIDGVQTWGTAMTFAGFTSIGALVGVSIAKAVNGLAMEIAQSDPGTSGARTFAGAVTSTMNTVTSMAMGSAGTAGLVAGRAIGSFVGKKAGIGIKTP